MESIHKTSEKGGYVVLWKHEGETPLQAMEDFFIHNDELWEMKRSYAGRLDPMAEGVLIAVYGDELKNKDKYIGLSKTYEIDVVLGIQTDTGDVLGIVEETDFDITDKIGDEEKIKMELANIVCKHNMPYPNFSSKTVKGIALHELTRENARRGLKKDQENPYKEVEIFSVRFLGKEEIKVSDLATQSIVRVSKVGGDFRQDEIKERWNEVGYSVDAMKVLPVLKLQVVCSSGTYMRWLCLEVGKLFRTKAFCNAIVRTKVDLL